jgi:ketosteroid isomerase-like protein
MKTPRDFFTIYKQSAWDKDSENMIRLYDEKVVIFDMWMHGYQNGLATWSVVIKDWLGSLGEEKVNVIFEMIEVREGDNVGFASALINYQAVSADQDILRSMKNRITIAFIRQGDKWKVVHQHTSAPIDSDLKAILKF